MIITVDKFGPKLDTLFADIISGVSTSDHEPDHDDTKPVKPTPVTETDKQHKQDLLRLLDKAESDKKCNLIE